MCSPQWVDLASDPHVRLFDPASRCAFDVRLQTDPSPTNTFWYTWWCQEPSGVGIGLFRTRLWAALRAIEFTFPLVNCIFRVTRRQGPPCPIRSSAERIRSGERKPVERASCELRSPRTCADQGSKNPGARSGGSRCANAKPGHRKGLRATCGAVGKGLISARSAPVPCRRQRGWRSRSPATGKASCELRSLRTCADRGSKNPARIRRLFIEKHSRTSRLQAHQRMAASCGDPRFGGLAEKRTVRVRNLRLRRPRLPRLRLRPRRDRLRRAPTRCCRVSRAATRSLRR